VEALKERRDVAVEMLNSIAGVRCIKPNATFYLYPSVTGVMARMGVTDYETFRRGILLNTGVSVCTRAHFGKVVPGEDEFYLRFAYSGIGVAEIREGLGKLKVYLENAGGR
jgi:aspartate/methionine/tyrosine aminotransferase